MRTVLSSASREAVIGPGEPFCIIGERINPTGRKVFQQQLRDGDLCLVLGAGDVDDLGRRLVAPAI